MKNFKKVLLGIIFLTLLLFCSACTKSNTEKVAVGDSTSVNSSESVDEETSKGEILGEDIELRVYPLYLKSLEQSSDNKFFTAVTDDYAIMYSSTESSEGTGYTLKLYSFDENGNCADLIIKEIYPSEKMMKDALSKESSYIDASEKGFSATDFDGAESNMESCIAVSEAVIYKHMKNHEIPDAKEQLLQDAQSYIDTAPLSSYTDYATDPHGGAFSSENSEFGFWFSKEVIEGNFFNNQGEGLNR